MVLNQNFLIRHNNLSALAQKKKKKKKKKKKHNFKDPNDQITKIQSKGDSFTKFI